MKLQVEIDPGSGFCGGVVRAIEGAEQQLASSGRLYSLGAIVHNEAELARLSGLGLVTATSLADVPEGGTVLIRAHGEPPSTYTEAEARHLSVIDFTCPVVLRLQQRIRSAYGRLHAGGNCGQLLIFGNKGHAEVMGLLGQVDGDAIVLESAAMLEGLIPQLDLSQPMEIFSQTTKSPSEYAAICIRLKECGARLTVHNTICKQVASRHERLAAFSSSHDVIVFVSGRSSSNGKVLSDLCLSANPRTWRVGSVEEISPVWFRGARTVGVCGATSTPQWLLEKVADAIRSIEY